MPKQTKKPSASPPSRNRLSQVTVKMQAEGYLSAAEVARRAKVHISTVYRWVDTGKVKGTDVAGHHYINVASVTEFLGVLADGMEFDRAVGQEK